MRWMSAPALAHATVPKAFGASSVAAYASAAVVLEIAAVVARPIVAEVGYAVLVFLIVNQVAVTLLRPGADSTVHAGLFVVLAIPLVLRLASLALEKESVVPVRHYAVIGGVGPAAFYEKVCGAFVIPGSEVSVFGSLYEMARKEPE